LTFFTDEPEHFVPCAGHLQLVPIYHIYGSDELSIHTPGIAERMPAPYIMLSPDDAKRYQVAEHHQLQIAIDGHPYTLTVKINPALQKGMAGIPAGLPGTGISDVPELAKV
jgi:NADH-quinone oxidoreductase subunit G